MRNEEIAGILFEISEYLSMTDEPFKPRAYERAAEAVAGLEEPLDALYEKGGIKALKEVPGVGLSIAEKIEELLQTGHLAYYDSLKKKSPVNVAELTRVEGLGPKKIKKLYEALDIRSISDLENAARAGKVRGLPGFGEKTEKNILDGIEFLKIHGGRFLLGEVETLAESIIGRISDAKFVSKATIAGSYRRRKETVGDLDVLVVSSKPDEVSKMVSSQPEVLRVLAQGQTKTSVSLKNGIDVDVRVVPPESYGAALAYFTGSKAHNVAMREIAQRNGMRLNEYGLFSVDKGGKLTMIAGETEEEIYEKLGLSFVEPEMREDEGEIELARSGKLPELIGYGDLQGDLQVQSIWTDGANSIEELALAAAARGLTYIAITDHTKRLAMAHGLNEARLRKQMAEIDGVNKKLGGKITVLKGSECDILKDGTLDLPDGVLKDLDVVGASVHSYFNLPRAEQTRRIIKAIENPNVDILFHPTGRLINRRKAYDVDIDAVLDAAKRTGTVMEINASPDRLDLKDEYVRKCVEKGVTMCIDSDAHAVGHFSNLKFGIAQARRGWAGRDAIANSLPLSDCLERFKDGKNAKQRGS